MRDYRSTAHHKTTDILSGARSARSKDLRRLESTYETKLRSQNMLDFDGSERLLSPHEKEHEMEAFRLGPFDHSHTPALKSNTQNMPATSQRILSHNHSHQCPIRIWTCQNL